jgi:ectoine hydroxylase
MQLTDAQVNEYNTRGYVVVPSLFSQDEVAALNFALDEFLSADRAEIALQRRGSAVARLAYGADKHIAEFAALIRHPHWILPARQLLADDIYMHQMRINPKAPFDGESFWWHQDYGTWRLEDGMPTSRALMLGIYLNDVTACNGPLMVIPGSHHHGHIDENNPDRNEKGYTVVDIDREAITRLADEHGIEALTYPAGSALFINCNLVHASPENLTPYRRTIVYLNANAVTNRITKLARAPHFANRDFTPLTPLDKDCILKAAATRKQAA